MSKKFAIRLIFALLIFICIWIGFKAGYAGIFAGYGLIAPRIALTIQKSPTFFVMAYTVAALLLVSLGAFSVYKIGTLNIQPVNSKQIMKMSFLAAALGFIVSLVYWLGLQLILILLQMLR